MPLRSDLSYILNRCATTRLDVGRHVVRHSTIRGTRGCVKRGARIEGLRRKPAGKVPPAQARKDDFSTYTRLLPRGENHSDAHDKEIKFGYNGNATISRDGKIWGDQETRGDEK